MFVFLIRAIVAQTELALGLCSGDAALCLWRREFNFEAIRAKYPSQNL
jgi:hypothetical protein